MSTRFRVRAAAAAALLLPALALAQGFRVEESTIEGMQKAIQAEVARQLKEAAPFLFWTGEKNENCDSSR